MHPKTEEAVRFYAKEGANPDVAAQLATADAVNRLADAAQRIATVAEIAGRMLTDPLSVVIMKRQIDKIGRNLEAADEQHAGREAKDDFARALGMTDAELAS